MYSNIFRLQSSIASSEKFRVSIRCLSIHQSSVLIPGPYIIVSCLRAIKYATMYYVLKTYDIILPDEWKKTHCSNGCTFDIWTEYIYTTYVYGLLNTNNRICRY